MTALRPLLPSLLLFACLPGCGPASSDEASSIGASVAGPDYGLEAGGTGREGESSGVVDPLASRLSPAEHSEAEPLVVPDWMAQDLASSDVRVKLKALDRWGQQGPGRLARSADLRAGGPGQTGPGAGAGIDRAGLGCQANCGQWARGEGR